MMVTPSVEVIRSALVAGMIDWVPPAVISMAIAPGTPVPNNEISFNLLADERMKRAWELLPHEAVTGEAIAALPAYQRLRTWGIPDDNVSLADQGFAAVFAFAAIKFDDPINTPTAWPKAQEIKLAEQFESVAKLCQWVARDPMFHHDRELTAAAAVMAAGFKRFGTNLTETGRIIDFGQDDRAYRLKGVSSPGTHGFGSYANKIRGQVKQLLIELHRIYGTFPRTPTATIATVAFGGRWTIPEKDVENWRKELREDTDS
jgi:hypothetical protein